MIYDCKVRHIKSVKRTEISYDMSHEDEYDKNAFDRSGLFDGNITIFPAVFGTDGR